VPRLPDDRFRIFVSHKHENHALAVAVQQALEGLSPKIECFVSGVNISAGADWNREIKNRLAQSHLLLLLFTRPTATWDWCLFETGLFTRADMDDVSAVVCVFDPNTTSPSPLASLQGVPADVESLERFLTDLCLSTWRVSDDWRLGALVPRIRPVQLGRAARKIVSAFPDGPHAETTYHPCHRVVLDLRGLEPMEAGIPDTARVIEGPGATTEFTLSLFNLAAGRRALTWGDLLDSVDGRDAAWRAQLDRRFVSALKEELFTPITATLRAWNQGRRKQRVVKPVLYRILREPVSAGAQTTATGVHGRPTEVTVVFDPQVAPNRVGGSELSLVRVNARFRAEVIDEFASTIRARVREGLPVLDEIREAVSLVYDEANTYGVFDESELRRVYGKDYEGKGLRAMGERWDATLQALDAAISTADIQEVEANLAALREMNRTFCLESTKHYLRALEDGR
jgi:TIR domain